MNLRQLIDSFRAKTMDSPTKKLWSDDEIIEYANEAVDEACRRAYLLVDSSSWPQRRRSGLMRASSNCMSL